MSKNSTGLLTAQRSSLGEIIQSRQNFVTRQLREAVRNTRNARILYIRGRTNGDREPAWTTPESEEAFSSGPFDYICGPDVLDDLREEPARQLVAKMLASLAKGGTLLLANVSPEVQIASPEIVDEIPDLHCRTEWEMAALMPETQNEDVVGHAVWRSDDGTVVYLEIRK